MLWPLSHISLKRSPEEIRLGSLLGLCRNLYFVYSSQVLILTLILGYRRVQLDGIMVSELATLGLSSVVNAR